MESIGIQLKESCGLVRKGEFFCLGVPMARGQARPGNSFILSDAETEEPVLAQLRPVALWQDGSPRWLHIFAQVDLEPGEQRTLRLSALKPGAAVPQMFSCIRVESTRTDWYVYTGKRKFRVCRNKLSWWTYKSSGAGALNASHKIVLIDSAGRECQARLDNFWTVRCHSDIAVDLEAQGGWYRADGSLLARFQCQLYFLNDSETLMVEIRLHNPRRAAHPQGLWDLGDSGSVQFKALEIHTTNPASCTANLRPEIHGKTFSVHSSDGIQLYQDSSGGDNWDSRNHINAEGSRTVRFRGYQVYSREVPHTAGDRATPIASLVGPAGSVHASVKQFWQNFPTGLTLREDKLTVGLFPGDSAQLYELQGGERKTLSAYFNYGDDPDALLWTQAPLVPVIDSLHYEQAGVFPWFKAGKERGPMDALTQCGVDGPNNFFAKREILDEYGWRNFGDVFADHETHYQKPGEAPLISHYNNQYDAIYGFARQFARTGDTRWFELMDDLARHVTDIDIYHTEEDRAEYNGGLFWHTDHYLDAHTATHRTFTRYNDTSSTPGQTGGGPASEHCYTTGLLYHYYLTGTEASRDAVLELAHWMTATHEGQGGLLEQLLALKKNEFPRLKALLRGEKPFVHRYPFTRGTGNYLNALLDAWLLQPEGHWLQQAEAVIHDTIHPADNIDQRDLLNVETGWSYLILLASVVRYLAVKEEAGQRDACYQYALESFLNYAEWMKDNERPFLADPEQLEFPNDTWVAQDVRKAMLMFQAASYGTESAAEYHAKGREWLEYVCNRLTVSDEAKYSRILIILLQNYGPHHLDPPTEPAVGVRPANRLDLQEPRLTWARLIARMSHRILRGLATFRPGREKAWLEARLDRS